MNLVIQSLSSGFDRDTVGKIFTTALLKYLYPMAPIYIDTDVRECDIAIGGSVYDPDNLKFGTDSLELDKIPNEVLRANRRIFGLTWNSIGMRVIAKIAIGTNYYADEYYTQIHSCVDNWLVDKIDDSKPLNPNKFDVADVVRLILGDDNINLATITYAVNVSISIIEKTVTYQLKKFHDLSCFGSYTPDETGVLVLPRFTNAWKNIMLKTGAKTLHMPTKSGIKTYSVSH